LSKAGPACTPLAQRVTDPEVLRILLSIGPTETAHFQTWHDKAGNAVNGSILPSPLVDPKDPTVVFPNLNTSPGGPLFQTNLIMPEPCDFLSRKLPRCSLVRSTETQGAAMGAARALAADGLFIGQSKEFFELLRDLAEDADEAKRDCEGR
jgi:hypothetical protein